MAAEAKKDLFVHEYLADPKMNGKEAAIKAGYEPEFADRRASEILKEPEIAAKIDAFIRERNERLDVRADNVVRELLRIAFMDIGEAFEDDGRLKPLKDMPKEVRRAIAGIETVELFAGIGEDRKHIGYTRKIKLIDKMRSLEILTKHINVRDLFPQRVELSGPGGGEIPMGNTELANRVLSLLTTLEKRAKAALSDGKPAGS